MKRLNLDNHSPFHKTGHTSKGDQRKWKIGDRWYKADYMGYESLAEVLVSHFLERSNLRYPFVRYQLVQIEYAEEQLNACQSQNFLMQNEILVPLEKLYRQYTGESLATKMAEFAEPSERIQYLVEEVEKITGINDFGKYITAVLEIDAFFLNEDRHTNNLAVVYSENTKQYSFSPIFDQGLCLFADTRLDYPLRLSLEECMKKIQEKPFSTDFDEQLDAAEALYGVQVQFDFSMKDLENEITRLTEKYSPVICERIQQLMRQQFRKYKYLIKQK